LSTLTKVFVVLLVVFSIAFTMSAISFVVKTADWRKLAEDYKADRELIEAHMRNLSASHNAEKQTWLDVRNGLDRRVAELETGNQRLSDEAARAKVDLTTVGTEKNSAESLARMLADELKVAQTGWEKLGQQRDALEQRNIELERRNQDLDLRVNEQATQIIAMQQEKKQLEQQINILRDENKKLASAARQPQVAPAETAAGPAKGRVTPLSETVGSPIRGKILAIEGERTSISVGSADGVEPGMVFVIFRGSDYVGDLEVTDVEPDSAAGRITRTRGTPRAGDMVADEARFGAAQ